METGLGGGTVLRFLILIILSWVCRRARKYAEYSRAVGCHVCCLLYKGLGETL